MTDTTKVLIVVRDGVAQAFCATGPVSVYIEDMDAKRSGEKNTNSVSSCWVVTEEQFEKALESYRNNGD